MLQEVQEGTDTAIKEGTGTKEAIKEGTDKKAAIKEGTGKEAVADKVVTDMEWTEMAEECTVSAKTDPNWLRSSVLLRMHVTCGTAREELGFVGAW